MNPNPYATNCLAKPMNRDLSCLLCALLLNNIPILLIQDETSLNIIEFIAIEDKKFLSCSLIHPYFHCAYPND